MPYSVPALKQHLLWHNFHMEILGFSEDVTKLKNKKNYKRTDGKLYGEIWVQSSRTLFKKLGWFRLTVSKQAKYSKDAALRNCTMLFLKKISPHFSVEGSIMLLSLLSCIIKAQTFYQELAGEEIRNRGGIKVISLRGHSVGIYWGLQGKYKVPCDSIAKNSKNVFPWEKKMTLF